MTTTPARARTDVAPTLRTVTGRADDATRRLGLGLTAGTLAWAASIFAFSTVNDGVPERIGDLTGLAFQLGVFCLLAIQFRTRATGLSLGSVVLLKVEAVILGIASVWSLLHGVLPEPHQDAAWLVPLDICWPLSMLGMAVISVKIAFAGRWRGVLRWWPLVAESWAVVTVPSMIVFGDQASRWVGGSHLLIGYTTLGVLLALKPHLVLPKD
ncbi:hypothetical protein E1218_30540 [Kribbella turkmenica]|uniref:Uncharacterized protein n=1 Tax=Kribbella turkmenica TaxID=2530375 RepID=A0A4R4WK53_9ACTN|nr:hypothetical protein [Kribbella turkmenica]TDD16025.1 hypothetical protein E1218_30540 [Kribbella turkmenica]